jgi:hypothetical protein
MRVLLAARQTVEIDLKAGMDSRVGSSYLADHYGGHAGAARGGPRRDGLVGCVDLYGQDGEFGPTSGLLRNSPMMPKYTLRVGRRAT